MADLKKGSPRLRQRLRYENRGDRYEILDLAVLLHNYRVNSIGLSQINTTYSGYWNKFTNEAFYKLLGIDI